jgi:hypothetical protein
MIGLRIRNDVSEPCSALAARILLVGRDLDRGQEVVKELKEAPWQLPGPPLARPWPPPLAPSPGPPAESSAGLRLGSKPPLKLLTWRIKLRRPGT